jgi:uncharacterized membrane protein
MNLFVFFSVLVATNYIYRGCIMSNTINKESASQLQTRAFSRVIDANKVSPFAPFHWLNLAIKDFVNAPLIAISYGLLFSIVPIGVCFLVLQTQNHLIILPSAVAFALIGPAFATNLYDVSWELEKGHKPTFKHCLRTLFRNPTAEWGFTLLLVIIMMAWMRIAAIIHVLYPNNVDPSLEELISFLTMGASAGILITGAVFALSAFAPQTMLERRVDIMTALSTSMQAVFKNTRAMLIWSLIIFTLVAISVLTFGIGFIVTMPILAFASWHAYIEVIKTKRSRHYT